MTTNPGTTNPGTTNPGTTKPGTTGPGTTGPGETMVEAPPPAPGVLSGYAVSGYIDRIDGCTVTGWAWARALPDVAVEIEIRLDDRPVARTHADRFRRDLAEARIGDGRHAFEAVLAEPATAETRPRIAAFARCGSDDAFVPLVNRTVKAAPPARHALPAATAASEATLTAALRSLADVLTAVRRQAGALEKDIHTIAMTLDGMAETNAGLARQLATIEVFQARIDGLMAAIERRETGFGGGRRRERGLIVAVAIAFGLAVLSLGFGLAAVLG